MVNDRTDLEVHVIFVRVIVVRRDHDLEQLSVKRSADEPPHDARRFCIGRPILTRICPVVSVHPVFEDAQFAAVTHLETTYVDRPAERVATRFGRPRNDGVVSIRRKVLEAHDTLRTQARRPRNARPRPRSC